MGQEQVYPAVEPVNKKGSRSALLSKLPLLLVLAAAIAGVGAMAFLVLPHTPGDNSAEAGFARDMMVHHSQAVEMAEITRQKTVDPEIRALATDIVLTQQAQIGQMQGWLDVWGLLPTGEQPPMAWMGHQVNGPMPGMATLEDLNKLREASPQEVDGKFLQLMIPHHQAAIPMAEAVINRTGRPEVRSFAQKVITAQQSEIKEMQKLLQQKGLPPVNSEVTMPANKSQDHGSHQ